MCRDDAALVARAGLALAARDDFAVRDDRSRAGIGGLRGIENLSLPGELPGLGIERIDRIVLRRVDDGIEGRVEVGAGSGSITLRDIRGDLDANAGSGTIRAVNIHGALRMHTGSGGIEVQGEQTGRWELQTGSGGIDLDLPPNAGFELNAHTGSGGIDVGFPMTVQGRIGSRHDVSGRVGNGGHLLNARTGSGHIRIQ
jgi:DUF4097 and DUF4098 domain-containing protein YvlB